MLDLPVEKGSREGIEGDERRSIRGPLLPSRTSRDVLVVLSNARQRPFIVLSMVRHVTRELGRSSRLFIRSAGRRSHLHRRFVIRPADLFDWRFIRSLVRAAIR